MAIFIPPAVFDKEDAVFHLPMVACGAKQLDGGNVIRAGAGEKVARVGKPHRAIAGDQVAIDAQGDLAAGIFQFVANVSDVVEIEPEPATIQGIPLFSAVSAAGLRS